eukprot:3324858-Pleurochrysis_carterae.AAC.1
MSTTTRADGEGPKAPSLLEFAVAPRRTNIILNTLRTILIKSWPVTGDTEDMAMLGQLEQRQRGFAGDARRAVRRARTSAARGIVGGA